MSTANKIIKNFAKLIEDTAFSNTTVSRLYGVSFGILMKDYDAQTVKELYEKIFIKHSKEKDMAKVFTFSTVLYNAKVPNTSLTHVYKKIEQSMQKITSSDNKYIYIS